MSTEETEIITPLTADERTRLTELEGQINRGISAFEEAGKALAEIRDARLYRADHKTFADYVQKKWAVSARRAYQLITAAQTSEKYETVLHISSERAALELSKVPKPEHRKVVKALARRQKTTGQPITTGDVQRALPRGGLASIARTVPKTEPTTSEPRQRIEAWYQENRYHLQTPPFPTPDVIIKQILALFCLVLMCGCARPTDPHLTASPAELENIARSAGIYGYSLLPDAIYAVPAQDWLDLFTRTYQPVSHQLEANDCDDLANRAAYIAHRRYLESPIQAGLAFGEFHFFKRTGEPHVLNIVFVQQDGLPHIRFFEPGTGRWVDLTKAEIESCTFWSL